MIVMPASNTGIRTGYLMGRFPGKLGHIFSPGDQKGPFEFSQYVIDNGVYAKGENWQEIPFFELLDWAKLSGQPPGWVIVPDVVGDRMRTLRKWEIFAPRVAAYGWPLAFAVQDGMEADDVPADAAVVFVGGSTEWKWQTMKYWCTSFCGSKAVHVGRVNSYRRLWECHDAGAVSCDGSGWMRGDQCQYRGLLAYLEESTGQRARVEQTKLELVS